MIQNSSLKSGIEKYFQESKASSSTTDSGDDSDTDDDDSTELDTDTLATEIILYKYLKNMEKSNTDKINSIDSLVNSYASQFSSKFTDLKDKYVCYNKITTYLQDLGKSSILEMTENEIDDVYNMYLNKVAISYFSTSSFSESMYGLNDLSSNDLARLKKIHYDTVAPIAYYIIKKYGISEKDFKIYSADSVSSNIGKEILFTTSGISPVQVYLDIKNSYFMEDIYECNLEYPYIDIIVNY